MRLAAWLVFLAALAPCLPASAEDAVVAGYHGGGDRAGHFVVPGLTAATAPQWRRDEAFDASVDGPVYAQPLYWRPPGAAHGLVVVASASNEVTALDAVTGKRVWARTLAPAAPRSEVGCGNINPVGVTGTPVIDPATASLYVDAMVSSGGEARHMVFGLSLADGSVRPGWPVSVRDGLAARGLAFPDRIQEERGGLAMLAGQLYIPFGGYYGDCGAYHGWVVGLDTAHPAVTHAWSTRAEKGGIWAPAGLVSDGSSLIFATGNTEGAEQWGDGEAIFRLGPDLNAPRDPARFFAAANWRELDEDDADLGGTSPTLVDLAGSRPAHLVLGLGKDGNAYLLDRGNLGGEGHPIAVTPVARLPIRSATATFPLGGAEIVAVQALGASCPAPGGLLALRVSPGAPPSVDRAWCAPLRGEGAPIVTTATQTGDPIVWILGAEGDGRLHAFRGEDGAPVFTSERLPGLRHFETILVAESRLYVAAGSRIVAFSRHAP